jgi:hypothetical protein
MSNKETSSSNNLLIIACAIFGLYALGLYFPDTFWAFHHPAFLPDAFGPLIVFGGVALTFYAYKKGLFNKLDAQVKPDADSLWRYGLPVLACFVFYQFPIFTDIYGDAHFILPQKGEFVEVLEQRYVDNLFSFDLFDSKIGTSTTVALIVSGSYYLGMTLDEVFRWFDALCGAGFVFFLLGIVQRVTSLKNNRLLLTLLVVGTPLTQVFCGHFEVYAPVYMLLAAFWYVVVRYYEDPSMKKLVLLFALVVLNIKFHTTGLLLFPIALAIAIYHVRKIREQGQHIEWRTIFKWGVAPLYILGIITYIGITKSIFGPRRFTIDTYIDAIFLPISSSDPAPLDRYNLFSGAHIFDYFSILFSWSAAAILILLVLFFVRRKQIQLMHPLVQISGYAMLLYLPLFFVFNPLFSMPADWDIMGIPGVTLLVFTILVVGTRKRKEQIEKEIKPSLTSRLFAPVIGLSIIGLSGMFVNTSSESQAHRIISMGKYQFRTYWLASSSYILTGINMLENDKERVKVHMGIIDELEQDAIMGEDLEYAQIVTKLAVHYRNAGEDPKETIQLLEKAHDYAPLLRDNVYEMVITYFFLGDFEKANEYVPTLVAMEYPNPNKALRVGIHTAIEAGAYEDAEEYCTQYLEQWPEEEFIQRVLHTLRNAEDKSEAKKLFRQS